MTVRTARRAEADTLTRLIAEAFHPIPPSQWLIPDRDVRRKRFVPYMRIFVDHGFDQGQIDVAVDDHDDPLAVAIWWPSSVPDPVDYEARLTAAVGEEYVPRFAALDAGMHRVHPTEPHHYLGFAASWPFRQGRGHGRRLLEHRHAELDAAGHNAYLAAGSERARRLYLRLGYTDHGEPVQLPGGPRMWPMWRKAGDNAAV